MATHKFNVGDKIVFRHLDGQHRRGVVKERIHAELLGKSELAYNVQPYGVEHLVLQFETDVFSMPNFFHSSDPVVASNYHVWHFVYLNGTAEDHCAKHAEEMGWEWRVPDLVVSDQPPPEKPGEYHAELYGMKVVAVLIQRFPKLLGGLVADFENAEEYAYAKNPSL